MDNWDLYEAIGAVPEELIGESWAALRPKSGKRKRSYLSILLVAAIITACLVGTAAAAVESGFLSWLSGTIFHRQLSSQELERMEQVSTTAFPLAETPEPTGESGFPAAETGNRVVNVGITANGTTITPLSAIYDGHKLYLRLKIEAPEGTVLADESDQEKYYHLGNYETLFPGYTGDWTSSALFDENGEMLEGNSGWEFSNPADNIAYYTLSVKLLNENDSAPATLLHLDALWVEDDWNYNTYTKILDGPWDIPLTEIMDFEPIRIDTAGMTTQVYVEPIGEDWPGGMITIELGPTLEITPLGVYNEAKSWSVELEGGWSFTGVGKITVVMKDGTEGKVPYDLDQIDYVQFNDDLKIPVER